MSVYIQKEKKVEKKFDGAPGEHIRGRHRTGNLSPLSVQRAFHLRESSQNAVFKFKSWKIRGKQGANPRVFRVCFQTGWITPVMARRHPAGGMVFHGLASGGEHRDGFSELKSFPRFFPDFSTIRVTEHEKSPHFTKDEKW